MRERAPAVSVRDTSAPSLQDEANAYVANLSDAERLVLAAELVHADVEAHTVDLTGMTEEQLVAHFRAL